MTLNPVHKLLKEKKIKDVINPRLIQGPPSLTVRQAIDLMRAEKSAYIVVADKKKVVGIFTETDVIQKIEGQEVDWNKPIRDFMTKGPAVLSPEDTVGTAIDMMAGRGFYHIPLVDQKGDLTGVLSVRTVIRFLGEFYPAEVYNLPPNPSQIMATPEGG